MLKNVKLKFTENSDIDIDTNGVIIFVGPNNSGKSLILKEIFNSFNSQNSSNNELILKDYDIQFPTESDIDSFISKAAELFPQPNVGNPDMISLGRPNSQLQTNISTLRHLPTHKNKQQTAFLYGRWGLIRLDGRSRFSLTDDQNMGDLLKQSTNILSDVFKNDIIRNRIRDVIFDAFGSYFVIDPTNGGKLRIRLSSTAPLEDEQSLSQQAREFHGNATYIKDASDGVQAFTGIVTAIYSDDYHTVLVDEPEAFLHPPLAKKLGFHLSSLVTQQNSTLMISTHSADFLMGCIQATKNVKIVRLEYSNGKSRGRMIDAKQLEDFFKRPLIRNTNVISGLFYDGIVVTESDNDRVFYQEIYNRITENKSEHPSILFVNAQNKQTLKDIMGPLRSFGVPVAAISDIDILKDGGMTWTNWLKSARIPETLHLGYGQQREAIKNKFEQEHIDMKKEGGITALPPQDQKAAEIFFQTLDSHGVFVVRSGELESWLKELQIPGKKTDWTIAMLDRLGSDPSSKDYVKPTENDVWEFIRKIIKWVQDPERDGLL